MFNQALLKEKKLLLKKIKDGILLININSRSAYLLEGLAIDIWSLVNGRRTIGKIIIDLSNMYDISHRKLKKDATSCVKDLIKLGLVRLK